MPPRKSRFAYKGRKSTRTTRTTARTRRTVRGKGAYSFPPSQYTYWKPGPWGRTGRKLGEVAGSAATIPFGYEAAGRTIGGYIGSLAHYIGRIFGSGDYKIGQPPQTNSLFKGSGRLPRGTQLSFGEHSFRLKRREYLCDLISAPVAGGFSEQLFRFNPGLSQTFPWMSQIAGAYETYKWHGAVVEFKTTSADALNSTNTALGTVIMAADYNAATIDQSFQNKQEMLNYMGAISCKPSTSCLMGIECDPKRLPIDQLYVRQGEQPAGTDIRLYDSCSFSIATTGFQASSVNVGEIHIIYDIEFFMPVQQPPGAGCLAAEYNLVSVTNQVAGVGTSGLLGDIDNMVQVFDNIGLEFSAGVAQAHARILLKDRRNVPSGSCFAIEWQSKGGPRADVGMPHMVTNLGGITMLDGPTTSTVPIGGPDQAVSSQLTTCLVYHIRVDDVQALTPITLSDNTGQTSSNPLPLHFATLLNTQILTASNTCGAAPCTGRLRIWQINSVAALSFNYQT